MSEAKKNRYNLTEGGIFNKLLLVSLPIIGTQIIQMTYNLTDMFWLGRLSSNAVAASGSAGMFLWLSMAFLILGSRGAEIGVSQNLGRGDRAAARSIGETSFTMSLCIGVLVGAVMVFAPGPLIGFFAIAEPEVEQAAQTYLSILGVGLPFSFTTSAVVGMFNGSGNSRTPFLINTVSLAVNMILDPILIFGAGMGIEGAAIATVIAQAAACVMMVIALLRAGHRPFERFRLFALPALENVRRILKWTVPISIESFLFCFLSMFVSRFVASFGAGAMAAQRIGSQVESLSWLIAGGFSSALTAFIGQNFGAGRWSRIRSGFRVSTLVMILYGGLITLALFFGSGVIFAVFLPQEPAVAAIGENYLRILALCQLIACLEAVASGAFRGLGRTMPPSLVSIASNLLRVVAAYFLMRTSLGIDGIWWAVSIGAAVRGLWMFLWYVFSARKQPRTDAPPIAAEA